MLILALVLVNVIENKRVGTFFHEKDKFLFLIDNYFGGIEYSLSYVYYVLNEFPLLSLLVPGDIVLFDVSAPIPVSLYLMPVFLI